MPTKQQRRALSKTLEQSGLGRIDTDAIEWLAFAEPTPELNKKVHRATNDLLFRLIAEGGAGRCIHVTGEMRALLDPFHRELCSQMYRQSGKTFSLLYNLPTDKRTDRNSAIGWSLKKWAEKGTRDWQEYLRTFDVIAERAVDVRASNDENEIQYSVFGNKYVLLQEKHVDTAKAKRVWLLKDKNLNEALTERGERLLIQSTDIDERWYRGFVSSIGGLGARSILRKLAEGRAVLTEELDDGKLREFGTSVTESAEALRVMDFAKSDDRGYWSISPRGQQYLALLSQT